MTDRSKFEEMLEHLVNEDRSKAEEIFHDIVVEKSREIYENLLAEENDEEVDEATDEEVDEATDEEVDEATDEEVDEATDEEVEEATDEEVEESTEGKSNAEIMREYTNKVTAKMGDNGANTKSPVASANDMGGSAGNIAQGADEKGGSADKPKEDTAGNVNVPGGSASKSMKAQPGHGAEKKSKPENADNKKAVIGN